MAILIPIDLPINYFKSFSSYKLLQSVQDKKKKTFKKNIH